LLREFVLLALQQQIGLLCWLFFSYQTTCGALVLFGIYGLFEPFYSLSWVWIF